MKMKGNMPEEALRKGSMPMGNGGKEASGNKQAASVMTKSESNHETLRHGSKPQPEKVIHPAPMDKKARAKAHGFNMRSENGGANPMAYPGCK